MRHIYLRDDTSGDHFAVNPNAERTAVLAQLQVNGEQVRAALTPEQARDMARRLVEAAEKVEQPAYRRYGIGVGQVYLSADGSKNRLTVRDVDTFAACGDVVVFDEMLKTERRIDAFKLARVRYALVPPPYAVKPVGYGGSTGVNDYLMDDGSIKAMRPEEVCWAPPQLR